MIMGMVIESHEVLGLRVKDLYSAGYEMHKECLEVDWNRLDDMVTVAEKVHPGDA
jgi:hypothetical protein